MAGDLKLFFVHDNWTPLLKIEKKFNICNL